MPSFDGCVDFSECVIVIVIVIVQLPPCIVLLLEMVPCLLFQAPLPSGASNAGRPLGSHIVAFGAEGEVHLVDKDWFFKNVTSCPVRTSAATD